MDSHLCLVGEAAWSTKVIQMLSSQGGANIVTLHNWLNTQPDKVSQFLVHILTQISFYTYVHTIYIKFI